MYVIAKDNGFSRPITYFYWLYEDRPALFNECKSDATKFNSIKSAELYIEGLVQEGHDATSLSVVCNPQPE